MSHWQSIAFVWATSSCETEKIRYKELPIRFDMHSNSDAAIKLDKISTKMHFEMQIEKNPILKGNLGSVGHSSSFIKFFSF